MTPESDHSEREIPLSAADFRFADWRERFGPVTGVGSWRTKVGALPVLEPLTEIPREPYSVPCGCYAFMGAVLAVDVLLAAHQGAHGRDAFPLVQWSFRKPGAPTGLMIVVFEAAPPETVEEYARARRLPREATVLDLGNVDGERLTLRVFPAGHVFAFEPDAGAGA